jgi:tRNA 2-selenouridine synthase
LALEAIEAGKWDVACRHILDYYDRTYDNDISTRKSVVVDVSGFSATEAANVLIDQGHVIPFSWGDRNEITAT